VVRLTLFLHFTPQFVKNLQITLKIGEYFGNKSVTKGTFVVVENGANFNTIQIFGQKKQPEGCLSEKVSIYR